MAAKFFWNVRAQGVPPPSSGTTGYLAELVSRPWYTANRPVVPTPLRTRYVDLAQATTANDGTTHAAPWGRAQMDASVIAGDRILMFGTAPLGYYLYPPATGTSSNWITYEREPGQTMLLQGYDQITGGTVPAAVTLDGFDYIHLKNLTVDNQATPQNEAYSGVRISGCDHIFILDCTIDVHKGHSGIISLTGGNYQWVEGCTINGHADIEYSNSGDGIGFGYGIVGTPHGNYVAYNNTIREFGHIGVSVLTRTFDETGHSVVTGVHVGFNDIASTISGGIGVFLTDTYYIEGNKCHDLATDVTTEATYGGNTVYGSQSDSKNGIIAGGYNGHVRYNIVDNAGGSGILLQCNSFASIPQHAVNIWIYNNVVIRCLGCPITITMRTGLTFEYSGNRIENNLFSGNHLWDPSTMDVLNPHALGQGDSFYGFYDGAFWNIWIVLPHLDSNAANLELWFPSGNRGLAGTVIQNNLFPTTAQGEDVGFLFHNASIPKSNLSYVSEALAIAGLVNGSTLLDDNIEGSNPQLTSTTQGNAFYCAINSNSPCIDAGNVISGIDEYAGVSQDIGVYEKA